MQLPPDALESTSPSRFWQTLFSLIPAIWAFNYLAFYGQQPNPYGCSHYFITYRNGFVKRGLLGEILSPLPFLSASLAFWISIALSAAAVLLTYLIFRKQIFGTSRERLLCVFLLSAPALLPHLTLTAGLLDATLYMLALTAAWSLSRWHNLPSLILAALLSITALLIHEAFALMFFPLIAAIALRQVRRGHLRFTAVAIQIATAAVTFAVILLTGRTKVPAVQLWQEAQSRTDLPLQFDVFEVLGFRFSQQMHYVVDHYTLRVVVAVTLTLITSLPYFWMLRQIFQRTNSPETSPRPHQPSPGSGIFSRKLLSLDLVLPMLLSPLLLMFVGHDVMRWVSAACINVSLYTLLLLQPEGESNKTWAQKLSANADAAPQGELRSSILASTYAAWFLPGLVFSLILGPFGNWNNRILAAVAHLLGIKS